MQIEKGVWAYGVGEEPMGVWSWRKVHGRVGNEKGAWAYGVGEGRMGVDITNTLARKLGRN